MLMTNRLDKANILVVVGSEVKGSDRQRFSDGDFGF